MDKQSTAENKTKDKDVEKKKRKEKIRFYVGIGASAGGLEAIQTFFQHTPANSDLAFIVIQHLSPDYKSMMVELLSKKTRIPVKRAEDGMTVAPNMIYLIPPKKNLTIFHGELLLKEQDSSRGINLPIDIFFRSLAEDQGERAIAVVLSGTGSDGTRGVRAIKEFGGMVMVQDPESAKFDGMPRAAISTGVADFILPPGDMPEKLLAFVDHPYVAREKRSETLLADEDGLTRIFAELREKTKVDFTYYKPSTITRRIERRMSVNRIDDLGDYVRYMQSYPGEVMTLYRELLIGVTSFFRDPEAMDALATDHLPTLFQQGGNRELRFWIAGCSTGEEAYTIAILTKEAMEKEKIDCDIKIFATDIDRDAIVSASQGLYPESIAADLAPKMLGKYFYLKEENYQIARHIREMVVFAQHNLIKDPPFTNIDLISCRNLLIYLQPVLQRKALDMFNFSLKPNGLLFLGTSETVGEMIDHFEPLNQRCKIYRSTGKARALPRDDLISPLDTGNLQMKLKPAANRRRPFGAGFEEKVIDRFLDVVADHFIPLSVIVSEQMEIVHIIGDTEGYFKVPSGRAGFDITKMAAKDIAIPLATGIQKVFRTGKEISYTNVKLRRTDETRSIRLRILPLPEKKGHENLVAVFFEAIEKEPAEDQEAASSYDVGEEAQQRIRDLENELQFARENLQATIEELETSNEELQATNEELLASNEELQSTNEELQSTNEELYTVNTEYQSKIIELTELNNDVENLLSSSQIGTLLLDENLEIRKFSPEIAKIFHIMEKDIGRPLNHLSHRLVDCDIMELTRSVQRNNDTIEHEATSENGCCYLVRMIPYHIGPDTFSGIVITFIDVTTLKNTMNRLDRSLQTSRDISFHMPAGLFIYQMDNNGRLVMESGNPEAERLTGMNAAEWKGKPFDAIWPKAKEAGLTDQFIRVLETGRSCFLENVQYNDGQTSGVFRIHAFSLPDNRLAVSFEDITEKKQMAAALHESEEKYRKLFETMAQGVVFQNAEGKITSANPAAEKILGLTLDQMKGRTSIDPRWKALTEDGSPLPGEKHPAMVALRTGKPVFGFVMGVGNVRFDQTRWILVNATPEFLPESEKPHQVFTTFEDITDRVNALKSDSTD